jgi:hypothetical protein
MFPALHQTLLKQAAAEAVVLNCNLMTSCSALFVAGLLSTNLRFSDVTLSAFTFFLFLFLHFFEIRPASQNNRTAAVSCLNDWCSAVMAIDQML